MNLSQLLADAIKQRMIDFESPEWLDFVFELLRQEPDADEVRLGGLLLEQNVDHVTMKQAIADFAELKTLFANIC